MDGAMECHDVIASDWGGESGCWRRGGCELWEVGEDLSAEAWGRFEGEFNFIICVCIVFILLVGEIRTDCLRLIKSVRICVWCLVSPCFK